MSSEAKHTPGPWMITEDGLMVYALHHNGDYRKGEPVLVNRMSARVEPCNHQGGTVDEGLANARLIAAAPELLEVLIAHDRYMLDAGYRDPDSAALHPKAAENWRRACAVIAKATGAA